jgi:hypothetical protein
MSGHGQSFGSHEEGNAKVCCPRGHLIAQPNLHVVKFVEGTDNRKGADASPTDTSNQGFYRCSFCNDDGYDEGRFYVYGDENDGKLYEPDLGDLWFMFHTLNAIAKDATNQGDLASTIHYHRLMLVVGYQAAKLMVKLGRYSETTRRIKDKDGKEIEIPWMQYTRRPSNRGGIFNN